MIGESFGPANNDDQTRIANVLQPKQLLGRLSGPDCSSWGAI